ncbi:MAG: hypothetical protein AAB573_02945 [Patescibacteria group bacterium]
MQHEHQPSQNRPNTRAVVDQRAARAQAERKCTCTPIIFLRQPVHANTCPMHKDI